MPTELTFENGRPTDAIEVIHCQNDDCDFRVGPQLSAFAFQDGCPWCGE